MSRGVLLVNLGTPDSPSTRDVRRYLDEFLSDARVLDISAPMRTLLVKGVIVPFRGPRSAAMYTRIWGDGGSPLLRYGAALADRLQATLGGEFVVELAMRYGKPDIPGALERLYAHRLSSLVVVPLFPQYASATTGSVHQRVMECVGKWQTIPALRLVSQFHDHPGVIRAYAANGRAETPASFDHVLFSFHGVPERQLLKADASGRHCLRSADCCAVLSADNRLCYRAQCFHMSALIAAELGIGGGQYTVSFQSRLGRQPWTRPYTAEVIAEIARKGMRRLLVFCPSFVADCLETLYEIAVENAHDFAEAGGETLRLVESLNVHPSWVEALAQIVTKA